VKHLSLYRFHCHLLPTNKYGASILEVVNGNECFALRNKEMKTHLDNLQTGGLDI